MLTYQAQRSHSDRVTHSANALAQKSPFIMRECNNAAYLAMACSKKSLNLLPQRTANDVTNHCSQTAEKVSATGRTCKQINNTILSSAMCYKVWRRERIVPAHTALRNRGRLSGNPTSPSPPPPPPPQKKKQQTNKQTKQKQKTKQQKTKKPTTTTTNLHGWRTCP